MSLIPCPECHNSVSDKALFCPSCGFPLSEQPIPIRPRKAKHKKRPNGSGSIVDRKGNYTRPFEVRVNTRLDDRGYPVYDVLGTYEDRISAEIALAEYNKDPYDPKLRSQSFAEVYFQYYRRRFKHAPDAKVKHSSTETCYRSAYSHCSSLYNMSFSDIRTLHLQNILDNENLSHATLEHIKLLFNQLFKYALEFEIATKNYAEFARITKEDDDEHGIPFTRSEVELLWKNKDVPFVDTILIYIYSGWRINELARMPLSDINLVDRTYRGGLKTRASRNRTIPIHSKIYEMVVNRYNAGYPSLIYHDFKKVITEKEYRRAFTEALKVCGITTDHTPHDCRHTCNTFLDDAGADRISRYRIMGHTGKDINEKVYTHKDIEQLRTAIELI